MQVSVEIRDLVATLAAGRSLRPGCCRNWTHDHVEAVRSHRLGPWLYKKMRNTREADLSAENLRWFEKDYGLWSIVSRLRAPALASVLEALESARVPVVVLKGAYLARSVYEDPGLRIMSDVDLLTHERDFESASQQLKGLGYAVAAEAIYESEAVPPPAMSFIKPGQTFDCIDLHRGILGIDYYRLDSSIVWANVVEGSLHGRRVGFLTPELNFIHIALHTLNHSHLLRDWLDLVLLARRGRLNWEEIVDLAEALKVVRPVLRAVEELKKHWDLSVPDQVMIRLSSYVPHWLEDRIIGGRFRFGWRLYAKLKLIDGWGPRLTYVNSKVFPGRAYRAAFGGDGGRLSYWGALLRHVAQRIKIG